MPGADGADPSSPSGPSGPRNPGSDPGAADRLRPTADSAPPAPGEGRPDERGGGRSKRRPAWIAGAQQQKQKLGQYQERLEQHRQVGFLLQSARRFKQIEGKHLALVICMNLFVAVIPLLIIGYAFLEAFNPDHTVGALLVKDLHLP